MSKRNRWIYLIPAGVGLLLAVGAMTVFTACGPTAHGTWMNCHNAQRAAAVLEALFALWHVLRAVIKYNSES